LEREHAAYEYVKQRSEQVHSLHVAMNSLVKPDADFFLETQIAKNMNVCLWPFASVPEATRDFRY
jgi:hypothetical protein